MTLARISLISAAVALALGLLPSEAAAEWKGKGEVGAVMARGNSDADTVNIKLDMSRELDRWKHNFGILALRATNDGDKTAERYGAYWQSDYKFSDRSYWFGGLRYEDDRFSGFDYQASVTSGIGRNFIDTDATKFSGQAGIGVRYNSDPPLGLKTTDTITTLNLVYGF